ncbi:MAG TPA: Calx-beta domain-containing protein [Solirubrobacteraceae bacterium]
MLCAAVVAIALGAGILYGQGWARAGSGYGYGQPVCHEPSINDDRVDENRGPATFTISAGDSDPQCRFHVDFDTADRDATGGADYTSRHGSVTLDGGQDAKVDVTIRDDDLDEPDEEFTVKLGGDGKGSGTGTIVDNDAPPTITVGSVSATEGTTAVFSVTLSGPSGRTITVSYATVPGSAAAGADFTPVTGTLTFAPGETAKTVPVTVAGDTDTGEGPETFALELTAPQNVTIAAGQSQGQATIVNQGAPAPTPNPPGPGGPGSPVGPGGTDANLSPPAADQTPPVIGVTSPSVHDGLVEWTVSCPDSEETCAGTVRVTTAQAKAARAKKPKRVLLGSKRYRLEGGEKKKVRVRINRRGVRLVRKRHDLPAKATFKTKDKAGNVSTKVQVFTLHETAFRHN